MQDWTEQMKVVYNTDYNAVEMNNIYSARQIKKVTKLLEKEKVDGAHPTNAYHTV